ncbi:cell division protein SepF [Nocardioides sp. GXZ039]|uniref:cell division protein SepF n=1 Tax=Nocardioides sp. GXZ039 TaxID=3136018 RepID=UPI0030F38E1D
MSGAMRRIGEYLGLLEDTGRYDEYDDYQTEVTADEVAPTRPERRAERTDRLEKTSRPEQGEQRAATVADLAERRRTGPTAVPAPAVAELSRITTLHPRTYNEARVVGENFRDGTPVIMNLTEMDDNDAKRLVDFAAGLVFATRGTIERITNKVFLLSPPNVSVAAEDKQRIAEGGGFFNQS